MVKVDEGVVLSNSQPKSIQDMEWLVARFTID
jgi:hypothetical protein